jgi:hypothetical protein
MANQRGGSEWEPIKILLEGDGDSNKMNAASNTLLQLTTQVGQAHVATGVPLDLGTNTQPSDPRTQRNTKPRVYRPTPVRPVSTTGQTGPCWSDPCGLHLTPLATGSLERSLLVFSTPGGLTSDDLSRLFFTCTNTSQAATCTCNT